MELDISKDRHNLTTGKGTTTYTHAKINKHKKLHPTHMQRLISTISYKDSKGRASKGRAKEVSIPWLGP
jgi:hemerythrin